MNDSKKVKNNLIVGTIGQIVTMLLGVCVPKIVLTNYGSEVNGLLSSVTNIYAYIALVEAGIAAASCQALYKPLSEHNKTKINAVLSATNHYYKRTGFIYLLLVLAFSMLYPLLIDTEIPYVTVILVILFNGIGNVINYFFHGKYLILLKADGKQYVRAGLEIFTNAIKQILKILFISLGYNVILVQFIAMLASFLQMVYITLYIKKYYNWINLKVEPEKQAISQSKNVLVHEVNYLITSNVDVVLLTIFTTLKTVSVYSLYHLLFSMISRVLHIVRDSLEFILAKIYHRDHCAFQMAFRSFECCYITLCFALFTVAGYFILPFIAHYTKGIKDIQYLDQVIPFLFVLINLLIGIRYPFDAMIHIAGHFKQTQTSAIIETLINVIVSILLCLKWGIVGVLLGTLVSSLYRTNYLIWYVNKEIIIRNPIKTYMCWGINLVVFLSIQFINRFVVVLLDSYIRIFLFCIPYTLITIILYFSVLFLTEPQILTHIWTMATKWKESAHCNGR